MINLINLNFKDKLFKSKTEDEKKEIKENIMKSVDELINKEFVYIVSATQDSLSELSNFISNQLDNEDIKPYKIEEYTEELLTNIKSDLGEIRKNMIESLPEIKE